MDSDTKAVVLDIDGTLCSLTRGVGDIYADLLAGQGLMVDSGALSQCVIAEWREFQPTYLNEAQNYRTNPERERWVWHEYVRGVLNRAGLSIADQSNVVERIYEAFSTREHRVVTAGAMDFLLKARRAGLRVIAATNNDDRSKRVLLELGIAKHLGGVFCAGELGWKKPSIEFFRALETRLSLQSAALLHVGNDLALDIEPARRAGWNTLFFGSRDEGTEGERVEDFSALERALHL